MTEARLPLPRRVMHVMNGATGGAALSTMGLIEEMARRGVSSCAVCLDAGHDEDKARLRALCEGRVSFGPLYLWHKKVRAARWKRPLLEARQLFMTGAGCASSLRVAAFGRAHGAELVHSNTVLTIEGAFAARRLRVGHVWHVREILGAGAPFQLGLDGPALGAFLADHASVVVANSTPTAARLRDVGADKLVVVDNGIDVARFMWRERPLGTAPVVAMVGNLTSRWKKHALFVDAAARVDADLGASFRIYGDASAHDPYVVDLKARAERAGLGERLGFPGFIAEPATLMDAVDVLVHPADGESFGRIVVEAWASGACVVGVDGGGVGAIVTHEHDGLLVPPDDAGALARAIERVLTDAALRRRLVRAGRRTAEERFSLQAHGARMAEVYQRAARQPLGRALLTPAPAAPTSVASRGAA